MRYKLKIRKYLSNKTRKTFLFESSEITIKFCVTYITSVVLAQQC